MTTLLETHRSFVNTWECDENDHMNVQFYLKRFDEASRLFHLLTGADEPSGLPRVRHVRYHREFRAARSLVIESGRISDGPFSGNHVHVMRDAHTRVVGATALDGPATERAQTGPSVAAELVAEALPRTLSIDMHTPATPDEIISMGGLVAHRCIVQPSECNAQGEMLQQFYIARFTDGAPHVWDHAGIGSDWLQENGFGRVAVELKITHHRPVRAGEAIALFSAPSEIMGKTVRLRHELVRLGDHSPVATGEVIALVMDLTTRKVVPMPEDAVRHMQEIARRQRSN